jgi:nitrite reductase (cytochrome c-552)
MGSDRSSEPQRRGRTVVLAALAAALAAAATAALLVNIFERKQEAKNPFFRVVELDETTVDPAVWSRNFPFQYDLYRRTVDQRRARRASRQRGRAAATRAHHPGEDLPGAQPGDGRRPPARGKSTLFSRWI